MQPLYFVADSFTDAKASISKYCDNINKPFNVSFNPKTNSVEVDKKIHTRMEYSTDTGYDGELYW